MRQQTIAKYALTLLLVSAAATVLASGEVNGGNGLGEAVPLSQAVRHVSINSDTTWLEVKEGEVIQFDLKNQSFAWRFNGDRTLSEIDLNKIAPQGALNHPVEVYIDHLPANYRG